MNYEKCFHCCFCYFLSLLFSIDFQFFVLMYHFIAVFIDSLFIYIIK